MIARAYVQLTARLSATLLSVSFLVASRRISGRRSTRTADLVVFAGFVVSHTIHFASVWWLSAVTNGATISRAGGWPGVLTAAALFYLMCSRVLASKARPADAWATAGSRLGEVVPLAILWLIFFQAYAGRAMRSARFAALASLLVYAQVRFATAAFRSRIGQADSMVAESV